MTDEVVTRDFDALPLSYGALIVRMAPVGLEPTTFGLLCMYSNRQSVMFLVVCFGDEGMVRDFH